MCQEVFSGLSSRRRLRAHFRIGGDTAAMEAIACFFGFHGIFSALPIPHHKANAKLCWNYLADERCSNCQSSS